MKNTKLVKECTQEDIVKYFVKREDGIDYLKANVKKDGTIKKTKYIIRGMSNYEMELEKTRLIRQGYTEQIIY